MIKNFTMNLKHLVLTFTLAIFAVAANAATVTYSLTTHVDNRTITGTANLNVGDNLEDNMPTALWRGYTHYTFYKDANKTQAISTWEEGVNTVYVDYVFDPPFQLSDDTKTVWNYFRNSPGTYELYIYFCYYTYHYDDPQVFYDKNSLGTGSMTLRVKNNAKWAFYGDAYSLNMKFNDSQNVATNDFMRPDYKTKSGEKYPKIGEAMQAGWQLYANDKGNGWFSLGLPNDEDQYLYIYQQTGSYIVIKGREGDVIRDSKNHITISNNGNWMDDNAYAFRVTPADDSPTSTDYWHVTYKILKADGVSMYPDYVMQKYSSNLTPAWPPTGFTLRDGYEYDRFYTDPNFTQKLEGDMPDGCNTVLYIKETLKPVEYVTEQWKTLVLPYTIENVDDYFGTNGVRVLKYESVQGQLNGDAFRCNLIFKPIDDKRIVAGMPYLFKADKVDKKVLENMRNTTEEGTPIPVTKYDTENEDVNVHEIGVSMVGVLDESGYDLPEDDLHFFFGSVPNGDVEDYEHYTYKFYRVGEKIKNINVPRFVCYFYVTPPAGSAPIRVSFGTESITGVSTIVADIKVQNSIYSLDGRKIDATSLDNLKRGIYIVNGRKVVK